MDERSPDEKVTQALSSLRLEVQGLAGEVQRLTAQVAAQDKKLRWITSVALVIVGAIGGPNAVELITNSGAV
jgi:hypothetical protein